jgi:hypothetical protein
MPLAILAMNFTREMPTEQVRWVSAVHGGADRLGGGARRAPQALGAGEVEEGLVDREALDQRGEALEDREDLARDLAVGVVPRREHDGVRAHAQGVGHRLGGAAAEAAGLVAGGRDHAAVATAADEHREAAQLGSVADLDRGEEGVHVDVQDGGLRRHSVAAG